MMFYFTTKEELRHGSRRNFFIVIGTSILGISIRFAGRRSVSSSTPSITNWFTTATTAAIILHSIRRASLQVSKRMGRRLLRQVASLDSLRDNSHSQGLFKWNLAAQWT
ncbi:hypothetical protein V1520DRAFT_394424 [Lipomyces starkeyi]|uniref:Uncharacterized protein n=1 Tax=Lipomyces starkeyi NRRL Y-11557 TaxID=675824 RepID=A0A1E3Q8H7_LIPST|nr:hypothetical protein LIPSTDRAFT_277035 [Lipomyces starkeyi NRRL Y-11557]